MADDKEQRVIEIILKAQDANASIKEMGAGAAVMTAQLTKMGQDDPGRAKLLADLQSMNQRLAAGRAEMRQVVQSEEELAAEAQAAAEAVAALTAANEQTVVTGQKATASLNQMKAAAGLVERELANMSQDDPGREKLQQDFATLTQRITAANAAMRTQVQTAEELAAAEAATAEAALHLARANEQTIATGKGATASLGEMKAAAALVEKQLVAMSQDDPNRAALQRDFTQLTQRIGEATTSMRTHIKTEAELAAEQAALTAATEKLNRENLQVVVDGQKVNATFNEMKASAGQLEKQLGELSQDDPRRGKMLADYKALGQRIEEVKNEMGEAQEKGGLFTQALAFAGVTVGAEAVLEGVKELGAEIVNTTKEVAELRGTINTLTGATGAELDGLTTSVLAVSRTFGKDFNEVLQAGNTLSKQMGVSQQEAMRLIQQGFLAGADAGGDFLDQVKEYAPQFKDAGFAAQDFIGHISQSATQGIFSDKGADVVKEFGLRIREQTKATSEAMQSAFGSDFTKEIFDGINKGTITVEQALQRVGKEMDETKVPASQLQTVIADVFGGPGEDAGIDYLKSLKNVGKGVDELVDKTNVYTQRQERLLGSQTDLAEAQNALTKEFEGGSTVLDTLANQSMTVLYTLLTALGATFKELAEPISAIWKSFIDLAQAMGWVSEGSLSAKSAGELLGAVIHALYVPTRLVYTAIADVVKATVEWAKTSDAARGYLSLVALPVRVLYELLSNGPAYFQGFSAAAEASFGALGRAWKKVKEGDFSGAKDEFSNLGKTAGDAYRLAFAAASAKKVEAAASSQSAGDEPTLRAQGGDGLTDAARQKAAEEAQKARDKAYKEKQAAQAKADQAHLDALKEWVKEEGQLLDTRNQFAASRDGKADTDAEMRRELERKKIFDEADKKAEALTGKEADYTEQLAAIVEARDLSIRELQAGFDEDDEKARQAKLDEQLKAVEADEEVEAALLENKRAFLLLSEQEYQDQLYDLKRQALEKQLQLLVAAGKGESEAAKKINAQLLAGETDHVKKEIALKEKQQDFEFKMAASTASLLKDGLQMVEDSLDKQTNAYEIFKAARKAAALSEVAINLAIEMAYNAKNAAELGPILGVPALTAMNILSAGRALLAGIKIAAFAKGGPTNQLTNLLPAPMLANLFTGASGGSLATRDSFAGGGPVNSATIGLIGEAGAELVIPNWLYGDPKQANLMGFLEATIASKGNAFATGGSTTGSSAVVAPLADAGSDSSGQLVLLVQQLVVSHQEFREEITDWQRNLDVNLDPRKVKKAIDITTKVQSGGGIR